MLFFFALIYRLAILFRATDARSFLPDHGDMLFYDAWAQRIAGGTWTDHHAFYGMPLYAYALGGLYAIAGHVPYLAVLFQTIAEAGTALCLYRLALLVFGSRDARTASSARVIGLASSMAWVFFVPAQAFSVILMPTAYLVCAFWWLVWWVVREYQRTAVAADGESGAAKLSRVWVYLGIGLGVGIVAMMVANILFLLPLLVAGILLGARRAAAAVGTGWQRSRRAAAGVALLFLGVGLGTAPCWLHNYVVARDPVLLSAHSGLNFWVGNSPVANGYPKIPPDLRADQQGLLMDSIVLAERAAGRSLTRAEVSAFWSAKAHAYITAHPAEWVRLLGMKLRNFWSAFQYDDLSIISSLREDGALLPGLSFGLVAVLGLPGLVLAARAGAGGALGHRRGAAAHGVAAAGVYHRALPSGGGAGPVSARCVWSSPGLAGDARPARGFLRRLRRGPGDRDGFRVLAGDGSNRADAG